VTKAKKAQTEITVLVDKQLKNVPERFKSVSSLIYFVMDLGSAVKQNKNRMYSYRKSQFFR
jgi:hypothetical protein